MGNFLPLDGLRCSGNGKKMRRGWIFLAVGLFGCPSTFDAEKPACVGAQALSTDGIHGDTLPAKTIVFTFDDGPASRTGELSTYLKGQGIKATFFVNNNDQQKDYLGVLPQIAADGHLIGDHTKNHPDLTTLTAQQIVDEVTDVDTLITPYVKNGRWFFRAPFLAYDMNVYNALQATALKKYVGHIDADIGDDYILPDQAADVACWQDKQVSTKSCGDLYVKDVEAHAPGIVLMHDADYGNSTNTNLTVGIGNTIDMVKYIVPILKAKGYTFVSVEAIPAVAAQLPAIPDAGPDAASDAATEGGASSSSGGSSSGASSSSGAGSSSGITPADAGDPCPPSTTTASKRNRRLSH
jgi:peptidoglycan/xylan/chitin deacetylase (PgdA/CDA1 family)